MTRILVLTCCASAIGYYIGISAQNEVEIRQLVESTSTGLEAKQQVTYIKESSLLQIGNLLIPVSENTHLETIMTKNGKATVRFYLQNGTTITDITDKQWKRSWWELRFESKASAQSFVRKFKAISR